MVSELLVQPGKSIIAAVGRSGTTILHRLLLEVYVDHFDAGFDCLYEPFVWDSASIGHYPRDKDRESQFGRRDALSDEGLHLHTRTPLFADNATNIPSDLANYLKSTTEKPLLAKFIRANGRLNILDALYPHGRFVIMLRNPFDVVNSVLTKFSFFGAEFHHNDFSRFAADINRLYGIELGPEGSLSPAYKAGLWCHFMNLRALQHAKGKPNYKVITYEDFSRNKEAYAREVCDHIGAQFRSSYGTLLEKRVGKITDGPHALTPRDTDLLSPFLEKYAEMVGNLPQRTTFDIDAIRKKYARSNLRSTPVEIRGLGWSPNRLESELIRKQRFTNELQAEARLRLAEVQRMTLSAEATSTRTTGPISIVVTSANSGATLRATLQSVRAQTRAVTEIIIADDGSTDGSSTLIDALASEDSRIRKILREQPVGAISNEFQALQNVESPFVCVLRAGDTFHTEKLERESRTLQGRTDAIAFSDTLERSQSVYADCSWLAGLSGRPAIAAIASRRGALPHSPLVSLSLLREVVNLEKAPKSHSEWDFLIRIAEKARHWLYSGGPGTLLRPDAPAKDMHLLNLYDGLRAVCANASETLERNRCRAAALAGVLKLMGVQADSKMLSSIETEDAIGPAVAEMLREVERTLLIHPASAYIGREHDFLEPLNHLMNAVGRQLGAVRREHEEKRGTLTSP